MIPLKHAKARVQWRLKESTATMFEKTKLRLNSVKILWKKVIVHIKIVANLLMEFKSWEQKILGVTANSIEQGSAKYFMKRINANLDKDAILCMKIENIHK